MGIVEAREGSAKLLRGALGLHETLLKLLEVICFLLTAVRAHVLQDDSELVGLALDEVQLRGDVRIFLLDLDGVEVRVARRCSELVERGIGFDLPQSFLERIGFRIERRLGGGYGLDLVLDPVEVDWQLPVCLYHLMSAVHGLLAGVPERLYAADALRKPPAGTEREHLAAQSRHLLGGLAHLGLVDLDVVLHCTVALYRVHLLVLGVEALVGGDEALDLCLEGPVAVLLDPELLVDLARLGGVLQVLVELLPRPFG